MVFVLLSSVSVHLFPFDWLLPFEGLSPFWLVLSRWGLMCPVLTGLDEQTDLWYVYMTKAGAIK